MNDLERQMTIIQVAVTDSDSHCLGPMRIQVWINDRCALTGTHPRSLAGHQDVSVISGAHVAISDREIFLQPSQEEAYSIVLFQLEQTNGRR